MLTDEGRFNHMMKVKKENRELRERIEGYKKAMVDFEKKSYKRTKIVEGTNHKTKKAEILKEIDKLSDFSSIDDIGVGYKKGLEQAKQIIERML